MGDLYDRRLHLMKSLSTLVLSLVLYGCSQSHDTLSGSAVDRVQPGKDIRFGDYVLYVEKREGKSLEGVRVVHTAPDGPTTIFTAKRGTLSRGADESVIVVVLRDAQMQKSTQKALIDEVTLTLRMTGL